jgi:hypothetical protein
MMNIGKSFLLILIALMLFFFESCNGNKDPLTPDVSKSVAEINVTETIENVIEGTPSIAVPQLPKYHYGDTRRLMSDPTPHHFVPIEGKELFYIVYYDVQSVFDDCKNKYGFTGVITHPGYLGNAHTAGFADNSKIFVLVDYATKSTDIDVAIDGSVNQFLYDEMGRTGILFFLFLEIAFKEIKARGGQLYADDYCGGFPYITTYYDMLIDNLGSMGLAGIGCDKYWDSRDIYGKDPREHWEYLRNRAGQSFNFSWIITDDINKPHWIELLDRAAAYDLKVFVYMGNSIEFYNMVEFCHAAFQAGWLREYDQKILYTYKCIAPEGTNDSPTVNPADWRVIKTIPQNPYEIFR